MPNKEHYQKHKEYYKQFNKQYRLDNPDKIKELKRKYWLVNKEKIKEKHKQYRQTPAGKKNEVVSKWKQNGIIDEDLPAVYDYYIKQTNCMICLKQFKSNRDRHLDHDHNTGDIRYICCTNCNTNLLREKFNN